jgi:hypothetical protein
LLLRQQKRAARYAAEPAQGQKSMNSYDDLYGSRFLAATDLKAPVNAMIERIEQETFARDGGPARRKAVLYFKNKTKGVVCNKTNAMTLGSAFGKNFSAWIGKSVTITPENTTFSGKVVKALRLYPTAQSNAASAPPNEPPEAVAHDEMSEEIPW